MLGGQPLQQREGRARRDAAPLATPRPGVEGEQADPVADLQRDEGQQQGRVDRPVDARQRRRPARTSAGRYRAPGRCGGCARCGTPCRAACRGGRLLPVDRAPVHAGLEVRQGVELGALAALELGLGAEQARRGRTAAAPRLAPAGCRAITATRAGRARADAASRPGRAARASAATAASNRALPRRSGDRSKAAAAARRRRGRPRRGRLRPTSRSLAASASSQLGAARRPRRSRRRRAGLGRPPTPTAAGASQAPASSRARRGASAGVGQQPAPASSAIQAGRRQPAAAARPAPTSQRQRRAGGHQQRSRGGWDRSRSG